MTQLSGSVAHHIGIANVAKKSDLANFSGMTQLMIDGLLPMLCLLASTKENKLFKFIPWKLDKWKASVFLKQNKKTEEKKHISFPSVQIFVNFFQFVSFCLLPILSTTCASQYHFLL